MQVIDALYYLHDSEIVYRDLKSDNVLVWSLDPNDVINIKLSDYGIAAFSTPQGVVGEGGTPGFQAPEIRFCSPYDEKVRPLMILFALHQTIVKVTIVLSSTSYYLM